MIERSKVKIAGIGVELDSMQFPSKLTITLFLQHGVRKQAITTELDIIMWRKCPPLVLLTCVISILLYVNNVYLHSRAVKEDRRGEERGEKRGERRGKERGEERGEEGGTGPPPPRTRKL